MANAAKRMKEKKAAQLAEAIKSKKLKLALGEVVEEVISAPVVGVVTDVVVDDVDDGEYTEDELNDMLKADLIELAESLGLDTDGKREVLIDRILTA